MLKTCFRGHSTLAVLSMVLDELWRPHRHAGLTAQGSAACGELDTLPSESPSVMSTPQARTGG